MQIGDIDYPVAESVLFFILILSLIFNSYLFARGEGNYSVKYELLRKEEFFRKNIAAVYIIEGLYKFFFLLPFLLLITISVMAAVRNVNNLAPILINGLIILLILYPTKAEHFYYKLFFIWLLTFGSQLSTFFLYQKNGEQAYSILSFMFYTGNILFFYLALVSIENVYWQVSEAITQNKAQFSEINKQWTEDPSKIPKIFDGGLYGYFCKSGNKYARYLILYFISILFLVAYGLLVHFILGSKLGYVGLVSAIIYDIFLQIFNSLQTRGRSSQSVYIVLVFSRFLSFVFGLSNWLLGYCVLYFLVAIFVGVIIIDKHFPMKNQDNKNKKEAQFKLVNALKTPEFVLVVLTAQIIIMIIVQAYALTETDPTLVYNNVTIPTWQWGLLALVGAWVVIIFLISARVLLRHKSKVFNMIQYYYGLKQVREYHLYLMISYLLLLALGLYAHLYLHETTVLVSCIFLPLIYAVLMAMLVSWRNNQYMVLADTEEYNQIMLKKQQIKKKRKQMQQLNIKYKSKKKELMKANMLNSTGFNMKTSLDPNNNNDQPSFKKFAESMKEVIEGDKEEDEDHDTNQKQFEKNGENSGWNFMSMTNTNTGRPVDNIKQTKTYKQGEFVPLRNWRKTQQQVPCTEIWSCLTPNDKRIIIISVLFILLSVAYCVACMLWAKTRFAISLMVCLISYLSLLPYFKFYKTKSDLLISEIIMSWCGLALGIGYWAAFDSQVVGPVVYSILYILLALYLFISCYRIQFVLKIVIILSLQILLCIAFIEITVALFRQIHVTIIFAIIFLIMIIIQVPVYYILVHQYVPKTVIGLCGGTVIGAVVAAAVIGYVRNILSSFAIFSIVMLMAFIALFATSVALYLHKAMHYQESPNIYSAYGQPNYKFQSAKQVLKTNNNHLKVFSVAMTTIVVYSVIVAVFFQQKQWAVYCLSVFWLLESFVSFQSAMSTHVFIGKYKKTGQLTCQIIKQSFLKVKNHYMADQIVGEDSPDYLINLNQAKSKLQNGQNDPEQWRKVVQLHDLYTKNINEQIRFCFFWIGLIMFNLMAKRKQRIFEALAQFKSIQNQLIQNGIVLTALDQNLKPEQKYDLVKKQIQALTPLDYIIYEDILQKHRADQAKKKIENEQAHRIEKEEEERRNQQIYNQMKKKESISEDDQIVKFKQLIKSLGRRNLFCDQEFPANEKVLGDKLQGVVKSWRRPNVGQMLTKGGITADDVIQGSIGDCYLVSSFAVLGEKRIKQALGYDANGNQIWTNQKGAFMVKFFKFSKNIYIILDDFLPVNEQDEWVFAKSQQPTEYWPCILEKAYAKMYGGYNQIVQGKSHQVLAQFTGGFPYEIPVQQYKSNIYGLWNQIITAITNGYLLAAGSPSNPKGDAVCSKRGIVQGHAYSILDAKQIDQFRLIKLKNPHGSGGRQWSGDFSDKSDLMTKRMMGLLNHTRSNDGIFWMPIQDFIIQYRSVYVCAVFDDRWIRLGPINGQWTDQNSFGTPNNVGAYKNPHYGIKVTKKCVLFVNLSQQSITALKGKNFIYMKALRNKGKRITPQSLTPDNAVGKPKRPTDAATISAQIQLQANEYPYTFSLMVTCGQPGKTGKYTLQAYCDDKNAQIIDDSKFDREMMDK